MCGVNGISEERREKPEGDIWHKNELLTNIISNIPHSVFWKNLDLEYLGCNENFAQNAGLKHPDDIIGKKDYDLAWTKEESVLQKMRPRRRF